MDQINETTYSDRPGPYLDIEVGDAKQEEFFPQLKVKKWGNEVNFSVRYVEEDGVKGQHRQTEGRVTYSKDDYDINFYRHHHDLSEEYKKDRNDFNPVGPITLREGPPVQLLCGTHIIAEDSELFRGQVKEFIEICHGDVLFVGMGFFLAGDYLHDSKLNVTVVEINQAVIEFVKTSYPDRLGNVTIVNQDFYEFVKTTSEKFDYIYGDIITKPNYGNIHDWAIFQQSASLVLRGNGVIDGLMKKPYLDLLNNPKSDDGHEFEIVLKKKPKSNIFNFSLSVKGLSFFYQPELTAEQKLEGQSRAESVVGSYAIYHSKKNNEYESGKVGHIYRPKLIDTTGKTCWADLKIDPEAKTMSITCPQQFLDESSYPIIVDPTFGYTIAGSSFSSVQTTILKGSVFASPGDASGATVSKITANFTSVGSATEARADIYLFSTLNEITNSETNANASLTTGNNDFTYSSLPTISASTNYVLTVWANAGKGTAAGLAFDAGSANQGQTQTGTATYPTWPNPMVPNSTDTNMYTIFATYTVTTLLINLTDVAQLKII